MSEAVLKNNCLLEEFEEGIEDLLGFWGGFGEERKASVAVAMRVREETDNSWDDDNGGGGGSNR